MSTVAMSTEDRTALEMVRSGYALDDPSDANRVLPFRVRFNDRSAALEAIRAIGGYNAFNGEAVAQALADIPFSGWSPMIEVGREGSPVVYIGPFLGGNANLPQITMDALRDVHADEVDLDSRGDTIRAWWD